MSETNFLKKINDLNFHFECTDVDENNKKSNGEVFTPPSLINEMIDAVLKVDKEILNDLNVKILEPASGIGNYTFYIFKRLFSNFKYKITDPQKRIDHIIKNCLYLVEINPESVEKCKMIFKELSDVPLNVVVGDALKTVFPFNFDLIIGNPPYNKPFIHNRYGPALYHQFILYYIDRCRMLCLITPSRWLKANKQFDDIRKKVLSRVDIVSIKHYDCACELFKTRDIDICGGVSYFIKDSKHWGYCDVNGVLIDLNLFDILVNPKDTPLITAIQQYDKMSAIHVPASYFRINSNDSRCHAVKRKGDILCHMSNKKGTHLYIDPKLLHRESNEYIVIFNRIEHHSLFRDIRLVKPNEVFSGSFNGLRVNNVEQGKSLMSYLKTSFAKKLLSLRKMTNGFSKKTIEWVILPPLDRIWTDSSIKKYYVELNEFDFSFSEVKRKR